MARLQWNERISIRRSALSSCYSCDIKDWRMMAYGVIYSKLHRRSEVGTILSVKDSIIYIPHSTIEEILEISGLGQDVNVEKYHTSYTGDLAPAYCWDCNGAGKFDWIQKTCPARAFPKSDAPAHFVRDESCYYKHPENNNFIFSKCLLEEGETHCEFCQGFGILIDARFKIFKGMRGFKNHLVKVETKKQ